MAKNKFDKMDLIPIIIILFLISLGIYYIIEENKITKEMEIICEENKGTLEIKGECQFIQNDTVIIYPIEETNKGYKINVIPITRK